MVNKAIFRFVLIVCWIIVIFCFSSQTGDVSSKQSEEVIVTIVDVISNKTDDEKEEIVEDYTFLIRKTAHIFEYFILAILIVRFIILFDKKYYFIISLILCFILACTDEYHQTYIKDRSGQITDALIDTSGSLLGLGIYYIVKKNK